MGFMRAPPRGGPWFLDNSMVAVRGALSISLGRRNTLSLTTTRPRRFDETSHWHWRHLLQSQRRSGTTGLVQTAPRNRCPRLGWRGFYLDRRGREAGCRNDRLVDCFGAK